MESLDKAEVLAALYNVAKPQGMGFLQYDPKPMTAEEAREIVDRGKGRTYGLYFDYLKGRVMKVDLSGDSFESSWFDRDNGKGAAELAINELREKRLVNSEDMQTLHNSNTENAIEHVRENLGSKTTVTDKNGYVEVELGYDVLEKHLGPALDRADKSLKSKSKSRC